MAQDPWAVVTTKPVSAQQAPNTAPQQPNANTPPDPWAVASQAPAQPQQNQPPAKPGFLASLAHALGFPGSADELKQMQAREDALPTWQKMLPHAPGSSPSAGRSIANALLGPGLPSLIDASKTAPGSFRKAYEEEKFSNDQLRRGNIANAMAAQLSVPAHLVAGLTAPIGGGNLETAGEQFGTGNVSGGLGTTTGILAPIVAPGMARGALSKVPIVNKLPIVGTKAPLGDTMTSPRGSTAAEAVTPAELQQYAADNKIPVTTAQLTEHNAPRHLQSTGERALAGGTAIRKQVNAAQSALADHVDRLADQMSPSSQTPNTAASGARLQEQIQQALDREKQTAESNYNAIDGKAKGMGVNMKPVKQLADIMATDSKFIRENARALDPKRGSALLETLSDLPDKASFTDAQKLRSALLDEARHPDNVLSEQAQGWIKRLTGAVDDTMMDSAQKVPGLEKDFRAANAHWESLQNDFNSPRSPLFQALKEPIPEKVPQKFLNKGQTGGSPTTIQLLDRYGIDKGPLKRELLGDLQQQDFKMQKKSLGGYDDGFLRALYSPSELDHVYKTGALARSVAKDVNPSGTAGTSEAIAQVRNPLRIVPAGAAAKLTLSPRFNRYLTRGPRPASPPLSTRGGIAAAMGTNSSQQRDQR
jgi:hypothetical protein